MNNSLHLRCVLAACSFSSLAFFGSPARADFVRQDWIQTYDAQGTQPTNGRGDEIVDSAVDAAGDVFVTGKSALPGQDHDYDFYTAKYSGTDGRLLWAQRYDGGTNNFDEPKALALDPQGNVIVTGYSILPRTGGATGESYDWYTVKYDGSNGNVIWSRIVNAVAQQRDEPSDVAVDQEGNVIVTGRIEAQFDLPNSTATTGLAYTIKYAGATGATLWEQTYRNDSHQPIGGQLAIDAAGNALLIIELSGLDLHLAIAKYAAADGAQLWAREEEGGEAGRYVHATDLAVNAGGDLFITGRSLVDFDFFGESSDLYTARFDGGTGARTWEVRTNRPNGRDSNAAISVAPDGNIITTGAIEAPGFDVYTTKYSAADGVVIWNNVYNSPGARPDRAGAIALDAAGNAYVAGSSDASSNVLSGELLTLKVRGTDGSLAWSRIRTTSQSSRTEYPAGIDIAPDGGVIVGASTVVSGRYDYLTIKLAPAGQPLNISTRVRVNTGENALIGGFIVTGDVPKRVLIRALGPSLEIAGSLADPTLEVNTSDGQKLSNDNWQTAQQAEIEATTIAPRNTLEAAIIATLQPGPHTAIVRGNGANPVGLGLVEVYDLDEPAASTLANISTRGQVLTGDNIMIGGFIIGPERSARVLLRGIGPSLTTKGVTDALQDPTLDLVDANGVSTKNDNWRSTQEAEINATGVAPTNENEAAIIATLAPGPYTAILRGNGGVGVGLVEAYNLQ